MNPGTTVLRKITVSPFFRRLDKSSATLSIGPVASCPSLTGIPTVMTYVSTLSGKSRIEVKAEKRSFLIWSFKILNS